MRLSTGEINGVAFVYFPHTGQILMPVYMEALLGVLEQEDDDEH